MGALIDGEALTLLDDWRSDSGALMTKRGEAQASFVAVDSLRLNARICACDQSRRAGRRSSGSSPVPPNRVQRSARRRRRGRVRQTGVFERCGRPGRYNPKRLIASHGADVNLPDLLVTLPQGALGQHL
jgi:hypothetical protein